MNKMITSIFIVSIFGFQSLFAMAGGQNPNQNLLTGAQEGNLAQVMAAVAQNANINAATANNTTALNLAAINDHYDVARYLIERGARINRANASGDTPLHNAVDIVSPDIVKLLLEKGAKPTLRNNQGQTPAGIVQTLDPEEQTEPGVQRIRQYFIEAARPTPEIAL